MKRHLLDNSDWHRRDAMNDASPLGFRLLGWPALALAAWALGIAGCSKSDEAKAPDSEDAVRARQAIDPSSPALKCDASPDGRCKASAGCSSTCQQVASAECLACEESGDCFEFSNNCTSPALSEAEQTLCFDLLSCLQTSNCFDGPASLGSCYCGKLPLQQCLRAPMIGKDAPDGACRDLILKGTPRATTQQQVLGLLTTLNHPAGYALARAQCQKVGVYGACSEKCGFGPPAPLPKPLQSQR
jgi:hypothetical protein